MTPEKLDLLKLSDFDSDELSFFRKTTFLGKPVVLNLDCEVTETKFLEKYASRFGELVRGWSANQAKVSGVARKRLVEVTGCTVDVSEQNFQLVSFDFVKTKTAVAGIRVAFRLRGVGTEIYKGGNVLPTTLLQLTASEKWTHLDLDFVNFD